MPAKGAEPVFTQLIWSAMFGKVSTAWPPWSTGPTPPSPLAPWQPEQPAEWYTWLPITSGSVDTAAFWWFPKAPGKRKAHSGMATSTGMTQSGILVLCGPFGGAM